MSSLPCYQQEDRAASLSAFPLLQVPTERATLVNIVMSLFLGRQRRGGKRAWRHRPEWSVVPA